MQHSAQPVVSVPPHSSVLGFDELPQKNRPVVVVVVVVVVVIIVAILSKLITHANHHLASKMCNNFR